MTDAAYTRTAIEAMANSLGVTLTPPQHRSAAKKLGIWLRMRQEHTTADVLIKSEELVRDLQVKL